MEPVCVKDEVLDEETQLVLIKEEDVGDEEEDGDAHPVLVKRERGEEEEEESARNLSSPSPPPPPPLLQWQCLERPDPFSKDVNGRHREDRLAPDGSLAGVDSLFPCRQCQRSFSSSWELTGHQCGGSDAEKVRFECPVCGDRFERPTAFIMHKRSHVGQSRYVCTECGRTWKTLKRLVAHRRSHAGDRPHQCQECGRGFKRARALQRHRKGHHGTRERAEEEEEEEEGGEGGRVREGVSSPAASPHSSLDQSLQCLQCFMTFRDVETTQRHLRFKHPLEYERRLQGRTVFACSVCEQTRPSSLQLSEHQRTHRRWSLLPPVEGGGSEGEEQQRERSERRQEEEGGLETLRASTADAAPLQCLHCHITFSDLRMKERHMRSQHPPGSAQILPRPPKGQPRPFCCTVCGERFIHEATLREHGRNNHQGAGHTQWEELWT
ncbi:zinc finger protein 180-like isoform X2 [Acipenser ruthenus]|uniref:zinc finger protein 180-like isoform X2 n=1 Tax=Acipenser ruthenus TaxID=7906 RepID=UPI0027412DA0|nr:zinc finger protein 180-like isoform X2 [Acipenser ruthenus]XP_058867169.1 zinc finger protein 180-like isoform X2 [Acipenser ruthenus]XP_058867170.1 zinc finger protein 180-like isoform X2 [Acipenser ruthenus]XP_058867171.1 zinc finger protein 180-like isoform X2 [Acipenser ruthenus]XP_058867172.1 zinc finger protein 180-like isoform X2 [Acipenser ruthenus]